MKKTIFYLLCVIIFSFGVSAKPSDNLTAYYPFDTHFNDTVSSYDWTDNGGVQFTTQGRVGSGLDLADDNKWLSSANYPSFNSYSEGFTVNYWFNKTGVDDVGNHHFVPLKNNYLIINPRNLIRVYHVGSLKINTTGELRQQDDDFTMITLIWNNTDNTLKMYLNGTLDTSSTVDTWSNAGQDDYIGGRGTTDETTGVLDEFGLWNRPLTHIEILQLYNDGDGCRADTGGCDPITNETVVTLISPTTNTRSNNPLEISYSVSDNDNATLSCDLYIDGAINLSNSSVLNDTTTTFNPVLTIGAHNWYINCTDGLNVDTTSTLVYDFDDSEPFIDSFTPEPFNSTSFTNFTMTIQGNVTDNAIWKVNRTIFYPNGSVFYNNYSGILANLTNYNWSDTFNTTTEPNGYWTMFIEATDPHTQKYFPPAKQVKVDNSSRRLFYELPHDNIEVKLVAGNVFGQFEGLSTTKLDDRYTFNYDFKNDINPNSNMVFRLTSLYPIEYIPYSDFQGHFILADKYWIDFEGVNGSYDVTQYNETAYEIELTTAQKQKNFRFESLGGLNEDNISIQFQVLNCFPDWSCVGFSACNTTDQQKCDTVTDNNGCGIPYSGDYSEFGTFSCNFCSGDFAEINSSECDGGLQETCYLDNNYESCCNITQIVASDCLFGVNQSTACTNSSCSIFDYTESDVGTAVVSTLTKFVIALVPMVVLIVIVVIMFRMNRGFKQMKF